MSSSVLTAVSTEPGFFVPRLLRAWEEGTPVMPVDHRLPEERTRALLEQVRPSRFERPSGAVSLDDPATLHPDAFLVLATSGTTGRAKIVQLSKRALIASATASEEWLGEGPQRWLCCLPLAHIAGLATIIRSHLAGHEALVHEGFDPAAVARAAEGEESAAISVVPLMLERLLDAGAPMERFGTVLVGGGPVPLPLLERARGAGVKVTATYGLTETCGGCVYDGWALPGVGMRVFDGEIQLAGDVVMLGYLDTEAQPFTADGWLRTNDTGRVRSDGSLEVLGRSDDIIITAGHKVSPVEVEGALTTHPLVNDAGVTWLPDPRWGQRVVAIVVTSEALDSADLERHLNEHLAPYAVPKQFLWSGTIPRSAVGKLDRKGLHDLARRLSG